MLRRVVRIVAAAAAPVVVVAAPGQELPDLPARVEVVHDPIEGNGPLQGLATGLTAIADRADAAVVTGCDAPFLTAAFLHRLVELRGGAAACVPIIETVPQPLPGVYAVGVLPEVRVLLAAGRLRLGGLLERVPTRLVTPSELTDVDPTLAALRNVNTPEDYARALADLGLSSERNP
jgi:molybdenum cofactor guanylyltransferase